MKFEIVIAHYNENLDWISRLAPEIRITIYSKGKDIKGIPLPNVGREAHTYLTHIINNYHNLSDFTIFCQGNPLDHSHKFVEEVNFAINSSEVTESTFVGFGRICLENLVTNFANYPRPNGRVGSIVDIPKFEKDLGYSLLQPNQDKIAFFSGAQFIVPKKLILPNGLHFYKKCQSLLDQEIDPDNGYNMERVWTTIFSGKELSKYE